MINKPYIMDMGEHSLIQSLIRAGFRPFMIDWGEPSQIEIDYSLSDYLKRLELFANHTHSKCDTKIILAGYCMGGILASLLASTNHDVVSLIVHIGVPWDFSDKFFTKLPYAKLDIVLKHSYFVPKEFFQNAFYVAQFAGVNAKYQNFANDEDTSWAFAVEHWVNDGIDMPKKVLKTLVDDLIMRNVLISDVINIEDQKYTLGSDLKTLSFIATKDSIVPMQSATAHSSKHKVYLSCGHVGLVTTHSNSISETIQAYIKFALK